MKKKNPDVEVSVLGRLPEEGLVPLAVVVHSGKSTIARRVEEDGSMTRGLARCHDGDTYSPVIGAVLALCRAYGEEPVAVAHRVLKALKAEPVAAKARKVKGRKPMAKRVEKKARAVCPDGMRCGAVKTGRVILRFSDRGLETPGYDLGIMGTPTPFHDMDGKALFVGDLVTLDGLMGDVRKGRHWEPLPGLHFVVDEHSDDPYSSGPYIMGLCSGCNGKTGKIDGTFRVRRAKTWQEVETGEVHDAVRPVWEDFDNE